MAPYISMLAAKIIFALAVIHMTVLSITIYLHRSMTHQSLVLHRSVRRICKIWLQFACGMNPSDQNDWIAVHRKHHAETDTENDPHNPALKGPWKLFLGAFFYYRESVKEMKVKLMPNGKTEYEYYTKDLAEDSFDRIQNKVPGWVGLLVSDAVYMYLFLWWGLAIWIAQTLWMPFVAGGVINVLGHTVGHRSYDSPDSSKSLAPLKPGFLGWRWIQVAVLNWATGGEHLHNPHHFKSGSAKFGSGKGLNFDIGYWWILQLKKIGGIKWMHVSY